MNRLLGSLKVWQKALLPLALCAMVAAGLSTKLIVELETTTTDYDHLIESEAPAAVWAARLNVTTMDLGRLLWRARQSRRPRSMVVTLRRAAQTAAGASLSIRWS